MDVADLEEAEDVAQNHHQHPPADTSGAPTIWAPCFIQVG
jgi:hypothetical protein